MGLEYTMPMLGIICLTDGNISSVGIRKLTIDVALLIVGSFRLS